MDSRDSSTLDECGRMSSSSVSWQAGTSGGGLKSCTTCQTFLELIERRRLYGAGLGWVDAHLLTAALIEGFPLWTLDKPLVAAAERVSVSASAAVIE